MVVELKTALLALALVMPRAFVCFAILPGFGTRTFTGIMRTAVSLGIALPAVVPTYIAVSAAPPIAALAGLWAFKEALIGLVLGTLLAIPIWVLQSVGSIYDLQRTPIQVSNTNPSQDQDASATGAVLLQAGVLVLIEAGLFLNFVRVLLDSYVAWPVASLTPRLLEAPPHELIQRVGLFAMHILLYTAPLLVPLLMVELAFAMLGQAAPQLQVSTSAAPVKCLVGMLVLVLYWATLSHHIASDFSRQLDLVAALYGPR
jgi:type III secretion protein T